MFCFHGAVLGPWWGEKHSVTPEHITHVLPVPSSTCRCYVMLSFILQRALITALQRLHTIPIETHEIFLPIYFNKPRFDSPFFCVVTGEPTVTGASLFDLRRSRLAYRVSFYSVLQISDVRGGGWLHFYFAKTDITPLNYVCHQCHSSYILMPG